MPTHEKWVFSHCSDFLPDVSGDMLSYSLRWYLRTDFHIGTEISRQQTFLSGGNAILFSSWKHGRSIVNHMKLHSIERRCNGFRNLVFNVL